MRPNDDIFGCFGNSCFENGLACFCPCFFYGRMIEKYNDGQKEIRKKFPINVPLAECNGCCAGTIYGCFYCLPFIPGTYLRILRNEEACTACLSYTFCPCCALLQDLRRIKNPNTNIYTSQPTAKS